MIDFVGNLTGVGVIEKLVFSLVTGLFEALCGVHSTEQPAG